MSAASALRRMFGGLLLATGLLMAVSCGLCTGYFALSSLSEQAPLKSLTDLAPFLAAGIVATVIGIGLFFGGLALLREPGGRRRSGR